MFCVSVTSVIVKEDDDAILPCSLSTNEKTESKVFDWKKEGTVQVFTYNNGDHHNNVLTDQNEQFRGRVSHFPEELKHGNASIKINKTMREDKGNYTCLLSGIKKFHVELVVGECFLKWPDYIFYNHLEKLMDGGNFSYTAIAGSSLKTGL